MAYAEVVGATSHPGLTEEGPPGQPHAAAPRAAAHADATNSGGDDQAEVQAATRADSLELGTVRRDAHAMVVEEELLRHFRRWVVLFSIVVCCATPAMAGLLVWLVVASLKNGNVRCQVPLQLWASVVVWIVLFNSTLNRPSSQGSMVHRYVCRWHRDPENPQPVPFRVWFYNLMTMALSFAWNCIGLHWVTVDGKDTASSLPACKQAAPGLHMAVKVYAAFNLAVTLFVSIITVGAAHLLRWFLQRGLLQTSHGAPAGSLEENTEEVALNDPAVIEAGSCSVCLEDFDDETPLVKTKGCDHVFHKKCLKGWLQVSHTCPLCRKDLAKVSPDTSSPPIQVSSRGRAAWTE